MPPPPNKSSKPFVDTKRVTRHVREIADAGDRWFLSVAGGLGRLGGWARREADIAADSAVAAFATTVSVAKKLAGSDANPAAERASSSARAAPRRASKSRRGPASEGDDSEGSSQRSPERGIDLLPAVRAGDPSAKAGPRSPELEGVPAPHDPSKRSPAGVVPLLQALGRTVADHTHENYASLQQDERFWTLIHLLQMLRRPSIAEGQNEDEAPRDVSEPEPPRREP